MAIVAGVGVLLVLFALFSSLSYWLALKKSADNPEAAIVAQIESLLPQTQCAQCGYPGCRPYAEAISQGAPINKCPPGGAALVKTLGDFLNIELPAQAPADNVEQVAIIDEENCIGCTKCIGACPVDAIIGGPKKAHTVLLSICTGCSLCIPPCPTECITLVAHEDLPIPLTLATVVIPTTLVDDCNPRVISLRQL